MKTRFLPIVGAAFWAACSNTPGPMDAATDTSVGQDNVLADQSVLVDNGVSLDAARDVQTSPDGSDVVATDRVDAGGPGDAGSATIPPAHPRIWLNARQKTRLQGLLTSSSRVATRFRDMVDRQLSVGGVYEFHAWYAALMYQLTGEVRYADYAIQQVDAAVAAEEALIAGGNRAEVAGDSYLYVGDVVGDLGLTLDWCFERVTPAQRTRWLSYANQAVWNVWHPDQARWGTTTFPWSGWSVDNPSNNYYYSFLRATLVLGLAEYTEDAQGPGWVAQFRDVKLGGQLVPTFARELVGGGSREGTGYGVAMAQLFRLYDYWEQSTGERVADLTSHTHDSMAFMLHEIVPTRDFIAPLGDHARDSSAALFDYHRDYAQQLAFLYPGDALGARLRYVLDHSSVPEMANGFMLFSDFMTADPSTTPVAPTGLYPAYHARGTGNVFLRSNWDTDAVWAHIACGPYTESHAHQDQGSFLLYRRRWLAQDENRLSHSGIQQGVRNHNLVRIQDATGDLPQREGNSAVLQTLQDDSAYSLVACDLAPVYGSGSSVSAHQRRFLWVKPDVFVVFDRVASPSGTRRIWQLNVEETATSAGRTVTYTAGGSTLRSYAALPADSTIRLVSWHSEDSDYLSGMRIESESSTGAATSFVHVLTVDTTATVTDASQAGEAGVTVVLADGRRLTARFNEQTAATSLELVSAGGQTLQSGALPQGVETWPLE